MPNYPTSAPSFTTKNTGDVIQAGHVNDLQSELVEIGTDLVGGTLRHDLTPSTTSTRALGSATQRWRTVHGTTGVFDRVESTGLEVAGGSTLLGNVNCTGTIGLSTARVGTLWVSQLEASSGAAAGGSTAACMLRLDAAMELPNGVDTEVAWTAQEFNRGGLHSTSSSNTELQPNSTGLWLVGTYIRFNSSAGGDPGITVRLQRNTSNIYNHRDRAMGVYNEATISGLIEATSTGDRFRVQVVAGGSTNRVHTDSRAWMHRMS